MTVSIRGKADEVIDQIDIALRKYAERHPSAHIEMYRQNSVSVRLRIVDSDFKLMSRADRHETIWRYLETLPENVQSQVSLLLALTPDELSKSLANLEFDNPRPFRL
jgi:stress-induced morphogen